MKINAANIWRLLVAFCDWRAHLRKIMGQSVVDAIFITNMRDEVDKDRFLGNWAPKEGHFNGPRYAIGDVLGRTRAINSITKDLSRPDGRITAQKQIISAAIWAERQGATVALLAAATKRSFGKDGAKLKKLLPGLLFTIGDNGTAFILLNEVLRAFDKSGLNPKNSRIAILGPGGILGTVITRELSRQGYDIIGVGENTTRVERDYGIKTCKDLKDVGKVDAVVACTHKDSSRLTASTAHMLRHKNRKLLVIDVAEPSNFPEEEYVKCKDFVVRQDAGNAYSPELEYILGAISYKMFRLTEGVTFGCFAETLALAAAIKRGENVKDIDWFVVNEENMATVSRLFEQIGFTLPSPRCFGKMVESFNLSVEEASSTTERIQPSYNTLEL